MDKKQDSKKTTTVNDIAAYVGMSASTVSRALNNHPKISDSTKEKVWNAAKKLGYFENKPYIQQQGQGIVLLLVDDLYKDDKAIRAIYQTVEQKGYSVLIKYVHERIMSENFSDMLSEINVVGIITLFSNNTQISGLPEIIAKKSLPIVVINKALSFEPDVLILPDLFNGAYIATTHLIKQGAKKTVLLIGESDLSERSDIIHGFSSAVKSQSIQQYNIIKTRLSREAITRNLDEIFSVNRKPDGILACNDFIAIQVYDYLQTKGIKTPQEVMVVSFGQNELFSNTTSVSISTIEYSSYNLGLRAAKQILSLIAGNSVTNRILIEPVSLIIRSSSMKV